jgi:uncharacterized membrane protein
MTWYELLLLLHIVAAIVWLGSGLLLQIMAMRAEYAGDEEGLRRIAGDAAGLTGGDIGLLVALAAIVVGGVAWVAVRLRAIDAEAAAPAPLVGP